MIVYKETFPARWQRLCQGDGPYWCECTLWAKQELWSELNEDVLITCGSICQIILSMCSKAKGWRSCLHWGWLSSHEDSFHATFPFFNVVICFKDAPELSAAAFFAPAFSGSQWWPTSSQLPLPLWSKPGNLHSRLSEHLKYFSLVQLVCRLSSRCVFGSY